MLALVGLILAVFAFGVAIDFIGARFQRAREQRERWLAGGLAALYGLVATLSILAVSRGNPWLTIPECLGYFVGTVLAVKPRPLA